MKRFNASILGFCGVCLLGSFGCDEGTAPPTKPASTTASSATGAGSAQAAATGAASAAPAASGAAAAPAVASVVAPKNNIPDLTSKWEIGGAKKPDGKEYKGVVSIAKVDQSFTLKWDIADNPAYTGVALPVSNMIAFGYGVGETYGVTVYKINGGELKGTWTSKSAGGKLGAEELKGPDSLEGEYDIVAATDPKGGSYKGKVTLKKQGEAIAVSWKLEGESFSGKDAYAGIGIKKGAWLFVGWGEVGKDFGGGYYKLADSKLTGTWVSAKDEKFGQETLTKKELKLDTDDDLEKAMMED